MYEVFYIIQVREDWYRLHIKDTHYCLGATHNLSALLETVKRLVKKYRTKDRLLKALSQMEDEGHVNEKTFEVYSTQYEALHRYFDELVKTTVKEALEEVKQNSTFNTVRRKLKKVSTPTVDTSFPEPPRGEKVIRAKKTLVLPKKKLIKV